MREAFWACACGVATACGGVSAGSDGRTTVVPADGGGSISAPDAGATTSQGDAAEGPVSDEAAVPEVPTAAMDADAPVVMLGGVAIAPDGQSSGALNGSTWASVAPGASGITRRNAKQLCMQGTIAAVTCPPNTAVGTGCNWSSNWGVELGFDTNAQAPWGTVAPTMLSLSYSGTPGTYNLLAHVAGDPATQWYGIPNYASGQFVSAHDLALVYWNTPPSTALSTFSSVDRLALFLSAEPTNVAYDFCIDGISTR